jgi:Kae1-associated kinase Bud32
MILQNSNNQVYLIDFGLAFHSHKIEDKAVDLHLLKQALEAKHFKIAEQAIKIIFANYKAEQHELIIERIKVIEKRGRYRH